MSDRTAPDFGPAHDWGRIRAWDGSQQRAFEELCFQLRDPAPEGWRTIKTAAPDGGVEWYDESPDGVVYGFQAKFVDSVDKLLALGRESAKTVGANRQDRNVVRLVFLAPIDLPHPAAETRSGKAREGARRKWTSAVTRWKSDLPGLEDVEIGLIGSGELLERLARPGNEGRRWFFFEQIALGPAWCRQQFDQAQRLAHERYTPGRHLALPLSQVIDGLVLTDRFRRQALEHATDAHDSLTTVSREWRSWLDHHGQEAGALLADSPPPIPTFQHVAHQMTSALTDALVAMDVVHDGLAHLDPEHGFPEPGLPAASAIRIIRSAGEALGRFESEAHEVVSRLKQRIGDQQPIDPAEPADATAGRHGGRPPTPASALAGLIDGSGAVSISASTLDRVVRFLSRTQSQAAEVRAWLVLGGPGQGKTHLLLDAVHRTTESGGAAVVVLGEQLIGDDPLTEIARALGLGDLPHTTFLQALDAAGAATGKRFLLAIDALNDSDHAARWRTQLRALLAKLVDFDHVAVVFSCRTTMQDVVLPADLYKLGMPITHHPGFHGREVEGLEKYLIDVPHALPRRPLLQAAFANPLFVKLYAENLRAHAAAPGTPVGIGGAHRSEVFATFLDSRAEAIHHELGLDPATRPVHRAVTALAQRMAAANHHVLLREEARSVVDSFALHAATWPKTMLGQLISHGVLATDRYVGRGVEPDNGVGFPYQAVSDDLIVRAALDQHRGELSGLANRLALPADSPLRQWLETASPNLREAATVVLPEWHGVELVDVLDAAGPTPEHADTNRERHRRHELYRAMVHTLPLRAAASVTPRTRELLNEATDYFLDSDVLDALVAVSTEPFHPLNGNTLHSILITLEPAERDHRWGIYTYDAYQEIGPLHRLLRWAEQQPTPPHLLPKPKAARPTLAPRPAGALKSVPGASTGPPADVIGLAATVLTWTLTSSHRFLRDRATKALIQLLLGFPDIVVSLLDKFMGEHADRIADLYMFARLLVVVEGVILRTGHAQPDAVATLARQVSDLVYTDVDSPVHVSRSVMLCGAAEGIITAAHRLELLSDSDLAKIRHPHHAPPPGDAPFEQELEHRFPRDRDVMDIDTSWAPLWTSLHHPMSDFARYQVGHHVKDFSRLPLPRPRPAEKRERRFQTPELDPQQVAAFTSSLPEHVREVLGTPTAVTRLLSKNWLARKVLDEDQQRLLQACPVPPPEVERLLDEEQDPEWACRWILVRVAEFGWTPQLFGEFDHTRPTSYGADQTHRAEPMGRKYQWIALHDLIERLANHYHLASRWGTGARSYQGAWELGVRDIDPSLPPTTHPLPDQSDRRDPHDDPPLGHTFPPADPAAFWAPPAPRLPARGDIPTWTREGDTIPALQDTFARTDPEGVRWIVLSEYVKDTPDGRGFGGRRGQAEQWHIIHTWLVANQQTPQVVEYIRDRSLIPRWMPEERTPRGIYLAEYPDAAPARALDTDGYSHELHHSDPYRPQPSPTEARRARESRLAELLGKERGVVNTIDDLATAWAHPEDPDTETIETVTPPEHDTDDAHTPLHAAPATIAYSWAGNDADCSINEHVQAHFPANELLRNSGLVRHPDQPSWYDANGTLTIAYRWGERPTGEVNTLLVREDWLIRRLGELGYDLIIGLIGELQRITDDPRLWREFSRCGKLEANGNLNLIHSLTELRERTW